MWRFVLAGVIVVLGAVSAGASSGALILDLDLSKAFGAGSGWHFRALQKPSIEDPFGQGGETVPGAISFCLQKGAARPCDPVLLGMLGDGSQDELFAEPHYLNRAEVVRPQGDAGEGLLLVQAASLHSGDGDQAVMTEVLAYRDRLDRFVRVYEHRTGRNNNQEVRYIDGGPLRGDIISVEPTGDAPFGFWVAVSALVPGQVYREVLRYRSATRYGDGNALAVIDSEMPNIERRLGLWRPGLALPVPAGGCAKARLIRMELWCG